MFDRSLHWECINRRSHIDIRHARNIMGAVDLIISKMSKTLFLLQMHSALKVLLCSSVIKNTLL